MVIDFQIHFNHPELAKGKIERKPGTYVQPDGTLKRYHPVEWTQTDKFIEFCDKSGIDKAVVSVMDGMRGDLRLSRMINDTLKEFEQKYPGRIYPYAHTAPLGGAEAFAELERCKRDLGYRGACMFTQVQGKPLDDKTLWPFYEKVCDLGMFLFIHPDITSDYGVGPDYDVVAGVAREGHLQIALARMINGGVLDDFPTLKIVFAHLGGGIAANLQRQINRQDRVFWFTEGDPRKSPKCKRPFEDYLKEMCFDAAGVIGDIDAVKMLLMKVPPTSIVFGTDYPYEIRDPQVVRDYISDFRKLPSKTAEIEAMLSGNGRKLLGI